MDLFKSYILDKPVSGVLTNVDGITSSGAVTITAGGTNQNITLTPSGTGLVLAGPSSLTDKVRIGAISDIPARALIAFDSSLTNDTFIGIAGFGGQIKIQCASGNNVVFNRAGTAMLTLDSTGGTFNDTVIGSASSTSRATLRIPHGSAPSSPVNGDMWTTTAGLFVRINGSTVGPLS